MASHLASDCGGKALHKLLRTFEGTLNLLCVFRSCLPAKEKKMAATKTASIRLQEPVKRFFQPVTNAYTPEFHGTAVWAASGERSCSRNIHDCCGRQVVRLRVYFVGNATDERFGGKHERRDGSSILQSGASDFCGINDTGLD